MTTAKDDFYGWLGRTPASVKGQMQWEKYTPKTWTESDIDIRISCCGICGSDIHTLRSGWGPANYPVCVGHEIVGTAVRVGSQATGNIRPGDRVGVGAQSASCLRSDCQSCADGIENHCETRGGYVGTYNGKYPDGSKSYGGYAKFARVPSHFVFKIPNALKSEEAAPMLCGGVTMYAPLVENGAGPGTRVGIVGVGGLGHFGILFARALGCSEVVAISRTESKKADAMAMGATKFIALSADPKWTKTHRSSLDLIINTVDSVDMPLQGYLSLLRTKGRFIQVGAPEGKISKFDIFPLLNKKATIGGSLIGSPQQIRDMLNLAAQKGVRPWVNVRPMKEANDAVVDFDNGKPRYRIVLVNEIEGSKL